MHSDLNKRAREILRHVIDAYVETGEPIGSRTISRKLGSLSPATIRNVMADLEEMGLLYAPHTSAGRLPTDAGLRLFVDGLLQVGQLSEDERHAVEARVQGSGRSLNEVLEQASSAISGLSGLTGLVVAPKTDRPLKHLEFVSLGPGRALVVLVTEDGLVENRVVEVPLGLPISSFVMASNYLNARLTGRTVDEARRDVLTEIEARRTELDELTTKVIEAGLAVRAEQTGQLIVRGQSALLDDVTELDDLTRIRALFDALETRETMLKLLEATNAAEGVQIFIGAHNSLFAHAGCSMIVAPYTNRNEQVVGAIGVIGPTRINYARIIPLVDYTAKVVGRLIG